MQIADFLNTWVCKQGNSKCTPTASTATCPQISSNQKSAEAPVGTKPTHGVVDYRKWESLAHDLSDDEDEDELASIPPLFCCTNPSCPCYNGKTPVSDAGECTGFTLSYSCHKLLVATVEYSIGGTGSEQREVFVCGVVQSLSSHFTVNKYFSTPLS